MNRQERLRHHLDTTGETLQQLQARSGVHFVTLSKIKNGADCRMSTWDKIERCLDESDRLLPADAAVQADQAGSPVASSNP